MAVTSPYGIDPFDLNPEEIEFLKEHNVRVLPPRADTGKSQVYDYDEWSHFLTGGTRTTRERQGELQKRSTAEIVADKDVIFNTQELGAREKRQELAKNIGRDYATGIINLGEAYGKLGQAAAGRLLGEVASNFLRKAAGISTSRNPITGRYVELPERVSQVSADIKGQRDQLEGAQGTAGRGPSYKMEKRPIWNLFFTGADRVKREVGHTSDERLKNNYLETAGWTAELVDSDEAPQDKAKPTGTGDDADGGTGGGRGDGRGDGAGDWDEGITLQEKLELYYSIYDDYWVNEKYRDLVRGGIDKQAVLNRLLVLFPKMTYRDALGVWPEVHEILLEHPDAVQEGDELDPTAESFPGYPGTRDEGLGRFTQYLQARNLGATGGGALGAYRRGLFPSYETQFQLKNLFSPLFAVGEEGDEEIATVGEEPDLGMSFAQYLRKYNPRALASETRSQARDLLNRVIAAGGEARQQVGLGFGNVFDQFGNFRRNDPSGTSPWGGRTSDQDQRRLIFSGLADQFGEQGARHISSRLGVERGIYDQLRARGPLAGSDSFLDWLQQKYNIR